MIVAPIAVAVSGGGRSLENFLRRERAGGERYRVAAVVASRPDCRGAALAAKAQIPVFIDDFSSSRAPDLQARLTAFLSDHGVQWIALAGFLKPWPIDPAYVNRIVNIHPALLPAFGGPGMYGERVHAAVLKSGVAETGASVHYVTERYDEGAVIAQARVPVLPGDDSHSLGARVFAAECELYPATLDRLIRGDLL